MILEPGAKTTFSVTLKPTAKGTRNAAIHIASDDPNEAAYDIALTGKGITSGSKSALAQFAMDGIGEDHSDKQRNSLIGSIHLNGKQYLTLTIKKLLPTNHPCVEVSPNLLDWYSGARHTTVLQNDESWLRVRDNTPLSPTNKRFIREKSSR